MRRSAWLVAAAVFVVALLPRLYVSASWAPEPVWDGHYYDIGAESIADGLGYVGRDGKPWSHYPVGYSALLGSAYTLFGSDPIVGKMVGAIVGALLAPLIYGLGRRTTTERRAVVAGLAVALYPGLIAYAAVHMTEPASALLLVAAALVAGPSRHRVLAAGALLGLGTLVRPQSILMAPFVGLFGERELRPMARRGAIATATALLVVAPWTVRNCLVMDGCAFVSTNGGWNLAIGAFPRATGRFETLRAGDGCHIVTGQVQQDRCWVRLGLDWIADDPHRWLALAPKKIAFTFDHESFPIGYLGESAPERWPPERRALGRGILSWTHRLTLVLATLAVLPRPRLDRPKRLLLPLLVGLWAWYAAWTPPHPFWPLVLLLCGAAIHRFRWRRAPVLYTAALVATLVVIHAIFFGEDRYHFVATPLLCLLAATLGDRHTESTEPLSRPASPRARSPPRSDRRDRRRSCRSP